MKKLILLFTILFIGLFWSYEVLAQDAKLLGKINIASPNAASLGKYGDIPVSYHTGIPQIGIPIHNIKNGPLQLSVSLSYHAGGLRVEENDSWVGAGWTLIAGGAITRTVRGSADEKQVSGSWVQHGYLSDNGFSSQSANSTTGHMPYHIDTEPDMFSFNFAGYSGKFFINDDGAPRIVEEQDLKIEYHYVPGAPWNGSPGANGGFGRCIESFVITASDGTRYHFGMGGQPAAPYCEPIEVNSIYTPVGGTGDVQAQIISSWFLRKIESVTGNHVIEFNYLRDKYAFFSYQNPTIGAGYGGQQYQYVKNMVAGVRLSDIKSSDGQWLEFMGGAARQDLARWELGLDVSMSDHVNRTSPALGQIKIGSSQNGCSKKFVLNTDYFVDNTSGVNPNLAWINIDRKRLKLNSIQETACDGTIEVPPHVFEYFSEPVLRKLSFARDHWGFNNGATGNVALYPALYNGSSLANSATGYPSANRETSWPAMRGGLLKKITYPTGGYTDFDFEPNTVYVHENSTSVEKRVGGVRVKEIKSIDPVTSKSTVKSFSYQGTNGLSSGVLYGKPTYIQIFRNDQNKQKNYYGHGWSSQGCIFYWPSEFRNWDVYFSDNSIRPMETTQGSHIGYQQVKVSESGNGYSLYRYKTLPEERIPRDVVAVTRIVNPRQCESDIPNYPAAPPQHDFGRGDLEYEGQFREDGFNLSEKIYNNFYSTARSTIPGIVLGPALQTSITETLYEIKTGRKDQSVVTIRTRAPNGQVLENIATTFFGSQYHNQATKILQTNSEGQTSEKLFRYSSDYVPQYVANTPSCDYTGMSTAGGFLSLYLAHYYRTFQSQFMNSGGNGSSTYATILSNFHNQILSGRREYVNCRKTNYTNKSPLNTYQANHNQARNSALPGLQTLLWMQDRNIVAPIETIELVDGKVTSGAYTTYTNNRKDDFGIYAEQVATLDLQQPATSFSASYVSGDGSDVVRDSRYASYLMVDQSRGNVQHAKGRDGVSTGYSWGYGGSLPVVKAINAVNERKEVYSPAAQSVVTTGVKNFFADNFEEDNTWPGVVRDAARSRTGKYSGRIDNNTSGEVTHHSNEWLNISLTQPTRFTYSGWVYSTGPYVEIFLFMKRPGEPNYFSYVDYVTTHENNKWVFIKKDFVVPQDVTQLNIRLDNNNAGTVWFDDIRLHPSAAQITTYTHDPLLGMTSQTDANNRITFFEHDKLGRLHLVRDHDGNIIKKYCYNYQGQLDVCSGAPNTAPQWAATGQTRCKPCPGNGAYISNVQEEQQRDQNSLSPTYNQERWVEIGVSSSCQVQPGWQSTGQTRCQLNGSNENTGEVELREVDQNPCSPTYSQERWVWHSTNTGSCPLPPTCGPANCSGEAFMCINGQCEMGYKIYTYSAFNYGTWMWDCYYHYEFSDGSWSPTYVESSWNQCSGGGDQW